MGVKTYSEGLEKFSLLKKVSETKRENYLANSIEVSLNNDQKT